MQNLLNPRLYYRLQQCFREVKISCQGQRLIYHIETDYKTNTKKVIVEQRGEAYCVHCPFCSVVARVRPDTRFRLYINHHWGFPSPEGYRFWNLVKCYNEDCLASMANRNILSSMVFGNNKPRELLLYSENQEIILPEITLPEHISLKALSPGHPALEYLIARGFDPYQLAEEYDLSYCTEITSPVRDRLLIPIWYNDTLYGWQARAIYPDQVPKYHTARGSRISHVLYGLDHIKQKRNNVFLVEGVTDVWRLGTGAVALFGCHISAPQIQLLKSVTEKVTVMLDGDALDKAKKIANKLQKENIATQIIELPANTDPADLSLEELFRIVVPQISKRR